MANNYQDISTGEAELKDYYNQAIKKRRLKRMDKEGIPIDDTLTDEDKRKLLMEE